MGAEGFPPTIIDAFNRTAVETNAVVMSRTPGAPTLGLINRGYDLKSFYNKMKSCSWGPMAGFVCRETFFNKNGAAGQPDNQGYRGGYDNSFAAEFPSYVSALEDQPRAGPPYKLPVGQADIIAASMVQIEFDPARIDELMALTAVAPECGGIKFAAAAQEAPGDRIGVAWDKSCSVFMEFLLEWTAPTGRYKVFTGRVFSRDTRDPSSAFTSVTPDPAVTHRAYSKAEIPLLQAAIRMAIGAAPGNPPIDLQQIRRTLPNDANNVWRPVYGMMNPYPVYAPDEERSYLNAVTGDYDLFAVWPCLRESGPLTRESLVRVSDLLTTLDDVMRMASDGATSPVPVFSVCSDRKFALRVVATPGLCIECVPGFKQIAAIEDPHQGNASEALRYVGQTLNAYIYWLYEKAKRLTKPVNGVFHSDEGGRPGVKDLEYPIAMFVPQGLASGGPRKFRDTAQPYLIHNGREFVAALTWFCRPTGKFTGCEVAIQYAWLRQLLLDSATVAGMARLLVTPASDPAKVKLVFDGIPVLTGDAVVAPLIRRLLTLRPSDLLQVAA